MSTGDDFTVYEVNTQYPAFSWNGTPNKCFSYYVIFSDGDKQTLRFKQSALEMNILARKNGNSGKCNG